MTNALLSAASKDLDSAFAGFADATWTLSKTVSNLKKGTALRDGAEPRLRGRGETGVVRNR